MSAWAAAKVLLCVVMSTMGMHYLSSGKKNQEVDKMLWGAALIVASFLFF